jgi:hypothetical protein
MGRPDEQGYYSNVKPKVNEDVKETGNAIISWFSEG